MAAWRAGRRDRWRDASVRGRHDTLRALPPRFRAAMSTVLTSAQTRFLRGQAHELKAMLQIGGKGVTDALVAEVDLARWSTTS